MTQFPALRLLSGTPRRGAATLVAILWLVPAAARAAPPQATAPQPAPVERALPPFAEWLRGVRDEAIARGVREETVDHALATVVEPLEIVVTRDRTQAEFVTSFDSYVKRRLTPSFLRTGRERAARNRAAIDAASRTYGVPAGILAAIWGLESNYGRFSGVRPTINALATLAYEPRRAEFFRGELLAALAILDSGDVRLESLKGSWAGAMGQPQFMPSAYLRYAVDADDDGSRDIWTSLPDVFASMANYLREHGWTKGSTWGREVRVPKDLTQIATEAPPREAGCTAVRNMSQPLPLAHWQRLGVRLANGARLPDADIRASLVQAGSRSFLAYPNYEALLAYNCAHSYALTVGLLADRLSLASRPPSTAPGRRR